HMGTPPHVSFIPEILTKRHPHSASSTHSPAPSTPTASCPHHTARHDSKARALRNATPAPGPRRNRADTIEHRTHNGTPNPTLRWEELTRPEVPQPVANTLGRRPHHVPTTTQTNHITATATIAQGERLFSSGLPPPLSRSKCR
ncbi:hypothetical protein CHARACLAT_031370, partial [Characodon lateralis]|nr:hypothetical protein [Characodon lateralis]